MDISGRTGVYILPRTEDGVVKIAYRGTKYAHCLYEREKQVILLLTSSQIH